MDKAFVYKCRLCLKNTSKKVDIFKHDFPKMIELLTGLKTTPNDGLPKESCLDCAKDVKFCMSVRKLILQSHKNLIKQLLESQVIGNVPSTKLEMDIMTNKSPEKNIISKRKLLEKMTSKRPTRKRKMTPESTSDEETSENYSEYSDDEKPDNPDVDEESPAEMIESTASNENIVEQITVIHDDNPKMNDLSEPVEKINVKSENTEPPVPELKTENIEIKEPPSIPPLSPQRLLRKRNMIAASNRILKQEKLVADRRYSNVIFIRKSMREKYKKQEQNENKIKTRKERTEDPNVIWKNGKKYAACEICKREVKKHYLKHHMTTHFPEHFSCDICGVTTRNLRGLRYHKLYWHSSKLDYICDKCGKKYRSKHALDLHNKKEHGGVRDLECNICGKKFFQKMHLKRHIDGIHKKLRPHKCEYCGKDFTKRTHLVTHWRTHTNETPYGCDMCNERFKLKLSLKNHLRRAHNYAEKERVFCDICNRGFTTEQGLRAHINSRVHEGEKCQYCSESFTPEYLKVHLREVHFHMDFY